MDEIDKKLLNLLQQNDKIAFHELKKKLKMAASTLHHRVKKLEKMGVIKSFSAIIDPEKIGYKTTAWLGLSLDPHKIKEVALKISKFKEVQLVAISSGDHDMVVQIIAQNQNDLWNFINNNIKTIDGVLKEMDVSSFLEIYKSTHLIEL